jgi:hypothetical protein
MGRMRPTALAAIAALALSASLVLAACGSSGSPAPASSSPSSSASAAAPSTAVPSASPSAIASPRPSPSVALVIPHEDTKLEAMLPDEVDGAKLTKLSVGPSSKTDAGAQGIADVAKQIGDGSNKFGLAYAGDPAGKFNLFALQIQGAAPSALATSFAQMTLADTPGGKAEASHLGGRDVVHIIDQLSQIGDVWFYVKGDTLYGVQAGSPDKATTLLGLLP